MLELFAPILVITCAVMLARAGLVRGFLWLANSFVAGLLAFNFWEPVASWLGELSPVLDLYADALVLLLLLVVFLGICHVLTALLIPRPPILPPVISHVGGALCGGLLGYLLAGMLLCVFQTLPLPQQFLGLGPDQRLGLGPPDEVWLAIMHRASGRIFEQGGETERWFDADASFIHRYARYRRINADGGQHRNQGEFPATLSTWKEPQ